MKFSAAVATIVALATPALSTVYITNPVASTKASGGETLKIQWQDSSASPKASTWGGFNIWLAAGSESSQYKLDQIASNLSTSRTAIRYKVPKDIGPAGQYYFIRFESSNTAPNGTAEAMSFSARFNLDSVTGSFNSTVLAAAQGKEGSASSTSASSTATSTGLRTVTSSTSSSAASSATSKASTSATKSNSTSGAEGLFVNFGTAAGVGALAAGVVALF